MKMAYLCEPEDVRLYSGDIKVFFLVEKENCGDVDARWRRERHECEMVVCT